MRRGWVSGFPLGKQRCLAGRSVRKQLYFLPLDCVCKCMLERRESPKEALWFPVPVTGSCVDRVGGVTETGGAPCPPVSTPPPHISPALLLAHSCSPNYSPGYVWGRGVVGFQWQATPESSPYQELGLCPSQRFDILTSWSFFYPGPPL